ncbi:MAG: hypothetical protein ACRESZ_09530, partial [Methylococcales bacterium]
MTVSSQKNAGGLNGYLRFDSLEHFRNVRAGDEAGLWDAVETLATHLDDHLVLVDETQFREGNICRLTVFSVGEKPGIQLYAGVTTSGTVLVGRADKLCEYVKQALNDFDPVWDEIISLAVTERLRVVGERLDLFVVTRRSREMNKEPDIGAYHGVVWLDANAKAHLQPARDDRDFISSVSWPASPAGKLPQWLRDWNFSSAPGSDPFDSIQQYDQVARLGEVDAVALAGRTLWYATGESLNLIPLENKARWVYPLPLIERAKSLAVTRHPSPHGRGVACCDHRMLFAFAVME